MFDINNPAGFAGEATEMVLIGLVFVICAIVIGVYIKKNK